MDRETTQSGQIGSEKSLYNDEEKVLWTEEAQTELYHSEKERKRKGLRSKASSVKHDGGWGAFNQSKT